MTGKDYTDDCILFRNVHKNMVKGNSPSANMFSPDLKGLSTDWDKFTTPEECLVRVGLTYKTDTVIYKDQTLFRLFELNVGEIRKIEAITDISHTPKDNDPEEIGNPNNLSHTDVFYIDEEIRLKLKGIAKETIDINRELVDIEVKNRRMIEN